MRIFIGLSEVSGFYTNLAKGFEAIGIDAEFVTLTDHRFQYQDPSRQHSIFPRFARWSVDKRLKAQSSSAPRRLFWLTMMLFSRCVLLVWAVMKFDVFIMGCATSFLRFRELPILKLFGKKIIYIFHGTDGRPAFMDGFAEDSFLPESLRDGTGYIPPFGLSDSVDVVRAKCEAYRRLTIRRKFSVDIINRYADIIVDSPSHGQHHTKPFVQRNIIGMPYIPNPSLIAQASTRITPLGEKLIVLHSPSFPLGKGSIEIRNAVDVVRAKGHDIDLVEMTGRSNHEVLEQIGKCDFVIDQTYSDMPMVGFATEAAFFGKPAIVGGYYATFLKKDLTAEWIPPTLFCLPEDLPAAVERLVLDRDFRADLGLRARVFVEEKWHAKASAQRLLDLLEDIPANWLFDPVGCDYPFGMGLPKQRLLGILRHLQTAYGDDVFCLNEKPALLRQIKDLAAPEPKM